MEWYTRRCVHRRSLSLKYHRPWEVLLPNDWGSSLSLSIYQLVFTLLALSLQKLKLLYVAEPERAPSLTSVEVLSSTSVKVEWQQVPETLRNGIITKYVISYTAENKTGEKEVLAPLLEAVVNGLSQSTEYSFRVRAETVKGASQESDPLYATTEGKEINRIKSLLSYEIIWFYQRGWQMWRDSKADVNPVHKTKLSFNTPHRRSPAVSLEIYPSIFVFSFWLNRLRDVIYSIESMRYFLFFFLLQCPYDQILDIHFFTFSYTIGLS